jgi:outer membrane protein OmpA-like peptidoglycan-associated protein
MAGDPAAPGSAVTTTSITAADEYYWERARRGAAPWIIGAVGLAALGVTQFVPLRHQMESDLRSRSLAALQTAGLSTVTVDFTGRDGRLGGAVTSPADVDRALAAVRGLDGVRVATAQLRYDRSPTPAPTATATATASPSPARPSTVQSPSPSAPSGSSGSSSDAAGTAAAQQALAALPRITFGLGDATLTPSVRAVVRQAAGVLRADPALRVLVEGFTDDLGDWDVNKALSISRAEAVRQALIADGIGAHRLTVFGWSEEHPKVPNTSAANRAINRRVEFTAS